MAAIDIAGFVAELKDHALDHGFHVHDERHFVETYSLRQAWEVDVHPEAACGGPLDLHLSLEVDPRVLLAFEDHVAEQEENDADIADEYRVPIHFTWGLPPLDVSPDLLILATDLAGVAGPDIPLEVSEMDTFGAVSAAAEHRLSVVGKVELSLAAVYGGDEVLCDVLDRCREVSMLLVERAAGWMPAD